jgi:hypothetical protein
MARRYHVSNAVPTTLAAGIDAAVTSLTVAANTGYSTSYPFTIIVDKSTASEEVMSVTNTSGTVFTVVRGYDGSTARTHTLGATVDHGVSAIDFEESNVFLNGTGVVSSTMLAADSVTTGKILDGTVALADLTTGLQNQLQGGTVLVPDALTPAPGEQLLKQAVWWIDAAHSGSTAAAAVNLGWGGSALNAAQGTVGNQPAKLDYAGTPYVYLPGIAGNSVSCTAPAAATSYAAYPLGGGAATTGAATGGAAFTFQTAGSWIKVDLLTATSVVCASFLVTGGSQTAYTDGLGVVWAVNRSTAGRKAVCVVAPCWLFGTDDYMEVPDNDLLDFALADSFTVVAAVRQWSTIPTDGQIVSKRNGDNAAAGWALSSITTANTVRMMILDGTLAPMATASLTLGSLSTLAGTRNGTTHVIGVSINGATASTTTDTATTSQANALPLRVGRYSAGATTLYSDMEFVAAAIFRRALSATEVTVISDYMKGRG